MTLKEEVCAFLAIMTCLVVVVFSLAFACSYVEAHFKAKAYNRMTGENVSTWDAMFVDLPVVRGSIDVSGD